MKPNDLYLSHWDSQDEVVLSENTIPTLKPFHYMPIRFLYSCFKKDVSLFPEDLFFRIT